MEGGLLRQAFNKLLDALRIKQPPPRSEAPDGSAGRTGQKFNVVTDGITIRGCIYFPSDHPSRQYPVVIVCHGVPGSGQARPSDDPGYEGLATELSSWGVASVIFNFRGCGDSGGNFSITGWTRDLEAVLDHVVNTPYIDPTRVVILGFSGGGAAAVRVAADDRRVYGLAVAGTPATFEIFQKDPSEIVSDFKERGIIRDSEFPRDVDRWIKEFEDVEPLRWIAHFKGKKLLIIHGDADELIPVEHARELFGRAPSGIAELSVIPGGVHRLRLDPRCLDAFKDWLFGILDWKS